MAKHDNDNSYFGTASILFSFFKSIGAWFVNARENFYFKDYTYDKDLDCYMDNKGRYHDSKSGKLVFIRMSGELGNEIVLVNENGLPVRFVTLEKNAKKYEIYEKEFHKIFPSVDLNGFITVKSTNDTNENIKGTIYEDLKTGEKYVIRRWQVLEDQLSSEYIDDSIRSMNVFININTAHIERPTDMEMFRIFLYSNLMHKNLIDIDKVTDYIFQMNLRQHKRLWRDGKKNYLAFYNYHDDLYYSDIIRNPRREPDAGSIYDFIELFGKEYLDKKGAALNGKTCSKT